MIAVEENSLPQRRDSKEFIDVCEQRTKNIEIKSILPILYKYV